MRKSISFFSTFLLLNLCVLYGQSGVFSKVRIYLDTPDQISDLMAQGVLIDHFTKGAPNSIDVEISDAEISILSQNQVRHDTLIKDVQAEYLASLQNFQIFNRGAGICGLQNFNYGTMGHYHTYNQVLTHLDSMKFKYPNLITAKDSVGTSVEGRTIWAIKISDNPNVDERSTEANVYFDALHHAREPLAMESLLYYMWWLLENYGTDPEATYLVNNRQIHFIPVVNPDGYVYNQTTNPNGGGMWRKNRRNNGGGYYGVDLNRNYASDWGNPMGSSPSPASDTYHGPNAFSEPESQTVRDYVQSINPPIMFSCHSYGQKFLNAPDGGLPLEKFETYSEFASEFINNAFAGYGTDYEMLNYYASGTTAYYFHSNNTYAWIPEIGSSFWAARSEFCSTIQNMQQPLRYVSHVSGSYTRLNDFAVVAPGDAIPGATMALNLRVKNRGLSFTADSVTVTVQSLNGNCSPVNSVKYFGDINPRTFASDTFRFAISPFANLMDTLSFLITIKEKDYVTWSGIKKVLVGQQNILFQDDAESGTLNWDQASPWDTTFITMQSGNFCFADTRYGNYAKSVTTILRLNPVLNLSGATNPRVQFNAKWSIEIDDRVDLEISTNGTFWTVLRTYREHNFWNQQVIDLSPYIGQSIYLRFKLVSDNGVQCDGIYFDDFRVVDLVAAEPVAAISHNTLGICLGDSLEFDNLSVGNISSWSWDFGPGAIPATANTPGPHQVTYSSAGPKVVKLVVSGSGGVDSSMQIISVFALPIVNAGADVDICSGDSTMLNATGGNSYQWSPATGLNVSNIANPQAFPAATTLYSVMATDANGCQGADEVQVTVHPLPMANAGPDVEICSGDSTMLNATGGNSYQWSPATGLNVSNIANPQAFPVATTLYSVMATDANGCQGADEVQVTVHPLPMANAGPDVEICSGDSTMLNATGGNSYQWSPATGLNVSNIANPQAFPAATTLYSVMATDANGCQGSDEVQVTVHPLPMANAGPDVEICSGDSTMLNATGGNSYQWSPATGLNVSNIANPQAFPVATTLYSVMATDANGCQGSDEVQVTVHPLPIANAGPDVEICSGDSTMLNATGGNSYQWSPATGLNVSNIANPHAFPAATTLYSVMATDANGCQGADEVQVTVHPLPMANAGPDVEICSGDSTMLNATGGNSYQWSPATGLNVSNIANPQAFPVATTLYSVMATDANGCQGADEVQVTVHPLPMANAGPDVEICSGDSTMLNATGGNSYQWSPATGLNMSNIANPQAFPVATTLYSVMATDANGCQGADEVQVTVHPLPMANAGPDVNICQGDSVQLNATGGESYAWLPASGLSDPAIANPFASPAANTTYTVIVTDSNGCSRTDEVTVNLNPLPVAGFSYSASGTLVTFTNLSTNFVSSSWNFGDGNSSSSPNPSHIYSNSGTFYVCLTVLTDEGCEDVFCDSVSITSVGIAITLLARSLELFPNPSSGIINISFQLDKPEIIRIEIYTPLGQVIFREEAEHPAGKISRRINLSDQPAGVYFFRMKTAVGESVRRVVIERE